MIFCIIVILLAIILDQLSKIIVAANLPQLGTLPLIEDVLHFTYVENRGAAFGMLADHRWIFMILSVAGIAALVVWLILEKPKSRWLQLAVSLIIGGGIGNMIDRIRLGYVIDFIDCRFIDFYVFNIADSCVCVGCAIFLVAVIADEVKTTKLAKAKAKTEKNGENAEEVPETAESAAETAENDGEHHDE